MCLFSALANITGTLPFTLALISKMTREELRGPPEVFLVHVQNLSIAKIIFIIRPYKSQWRSQLSDHSLLELLI